MSTTLLSLEQQIAAQYKAESGQGMASGTCSAAGTTTQIVDTSGDSPLDPSDSDSLYDGFWLRIDSDSAGTPLNVGELRRIVSGGYTPGNGTLTLSRALSNATTSTQTYGLYAIPPDTWGTIRGIKAFINDILPRLSYRFPVLLTLVTDGDMETSGVTAWTDVGTCTQAKSTTTGITQGKQSLSLTNGAANSGVKNTTPIPVVEGTTYQVVADVLCDGYTANLKCYDLTNAATIDTVQTTAERGQRFLYDQITIPSDCKRLEIHLLGEDADAVHYWDNLSVRRIGATEMAMPSWFTNPLWFEWLYYTRAGHQEQDADSYSTDERSPYVPVHNCGITEDPNGTGYKVWWEGTAIPATAHLFAMCKRPYTELSALTDTTDADPDLVTAFVLANIYADRKDKDNAALWLRRARDLEKPLPKLQPRPMKVRGL